MLPLGVSRGFAFVEFSRVSDAQKWMETKKVKRKRELMEAFGIDSCDDIQSTPPPQSQPARANQEQEDKTLIHIHLIIVFLWFLTPSPLHIF